MYIRLKLVQMIVYWQLAVCMGSLMAILVFSVAVAKGRLPKNDITIKYVKIIFCAIFLVSAVSILFTAKL
jgi:putative Ca2+/H+ antiporter (TMEM165/GDT1 family)